MNCDKKSSSARRNLPASLALTDPQWPDGNSAATAPAWISCWHWRRYLGARWTSWCRNPQKRHSASTYFRTFSITRPLQLLLLCRLWFICFHIHFQKEGNLMATVKYTNCPHCHQRKLGPYNVSTTSKNITKGTCPHCGKRYAIEYGQGRIRARKA